MPPAWSPAEQTTSTSEPDQQCVGCGTAACLPRVPCTVTWIAWSVLAPDVALRAPPSPWSRPVSVAAPHARQPCAQGTPATPRYLLLLLMWLHQWYPHPFYPSHSHPYSPCDWTWSLNRARASSPKRSGTPPHNRHTWSTCNESSTPRNQSNHQTEATSRVQGGA